MFHLLALLLYFFTSDASECKKFDFTYAPAMPLDMCIGTPDCSLIPGFTGGASGCWVKYVCDVNDVVNYHYYSAGTCDDSDEYVAMRTSINCNDDRVSCTSYCNSIVECPVYQENWYEDSGCNGNVQYTGLVILDECQTFGTPTQGFSLKAICDGDVVVQTRYSDANCQSVNQVNRLEDNCYGHYNFKCGESITASSNPLDPSGCIYMLDAFCIKWLYVYIAIGCILCICILCVLCVCCKSRNKGKNRNDIEMGTNPY
eukprot:297089_1